MAVNYEQTAADIDAARRAALAEVAARNDPNDQQAQTALARMAQLHATRQGSAGSRWDNFTAGIAPGQAARIAGINQSTQAAIAQAGDDILHTRRMEDFKKWYDTLLDQQRAAGGYGGGGGGGRGGGGSADEPATYITPQAAPRLSLADMFAPAAPPSRPAPPPRTTRTRTPPPPARTYTSRAGSVAAAQRPPVGRVATRYS
jgi:hypothetical protein